MSIVYDSTEDWQAPFGYYRSEVEKVSPSTYTRFRDKFVIAEIDGTDVALEQWYPNNVETLEIGQAVVVQQHEEGRLDIIAQNYLGNWRYWWIIAVLNGIRDVVSDVTMGMQLILPSKSAVQGYISRW